MAGFIFRWLSSNKIQFNQRYVAPLHCDCVSFVAIATRLCPSSWGQNDLWVGDELLHPELRVSAAYLVASDWPFRMTYRGSCLLPRSHDWPHQSRDLSREREPYLYWFSLETVIHISDALGGGLAHYDMTFLYKFSLFYGYASTSLLFLPHAFTDISYRLGSTSLLFAAFILPRKYTDASSSSSRERKHWPKKNVFLKNITVVVCLLTYYLKRRIYKP